MHGEQANLVDWTGGQANWAVHVSYQFFLNPQSYVYLHYWMAVNVAFFFNLVLFAIHA